MEITEIFEVTYDHQWQGQNFGLFSKLEKAIAFLKNRGVDVSELKESCGVYIFGDYRITKKSVY
jgi:hypothetical protein